MHIELSFYYRLFRGIFMTLICIALSNCSSKSFYAHQQDVHIKTFVDAPKGSYVHSYAVSSLSGTVRNRGKNYKIMLAENIGELRQETETALLKFPQKFQTISFTLQSNSSLNSLKTPLTLLEIKDNVNNLTLLRLNTQNQIYWLDGNNFYEKIRFYPHQQAENIVIYNHGHTYDIMIGNKHYIIPMTNNSVITVGLKRSDLFRYRGMLIPQQQLDVYDVVME